MNLDPWGQKRPTKIEKINNNSCFEVMDVFFWGLRASAIA
jgi:hypothetical protein